MFAKDEERTMARVNTIIGEGCVFKGDIKVEGSVEIDGQFDGTIEASDTLIVGGTGKVEADATVENAVIGGKMYGNVFASGKIELQRGSQLLGDVKTRGLVIEDGVVFQGNCQMGDVDAPPPRMTETTYEAEEEELEETEATV